MFDHHHLTMAFDHEPRVADEPPPQYDHELFAHLKCDACSEEFTQSLLVMDVHLYEEMQL